MILGGALTAFAQANSDLSRPLTLALADATSSGGGASGSEDVKAQAAELAKKTLNPIASLISVPFQHTGTLGSAPMVKVGRQPISLQLGYRYYADGPDGGPDWGLRFTVTFLFPK